MIAAELRPPRAELGSREGMDAWIDMYHAVRSLARREVRVFLTDSAVGTQEENNLRHLVTNLGRDVTREHVIPFLKGRNYSAGSIPIRGALPQADRAKFGKSEIDVRNIFVRCGIDEWTWQMYLKVPRVPNLRVKAKPFFVTTRDIPPGPFRLCGWPSAQTHLTV